MVNIAQWHLNSEVCPDNLDFREEDSGNVYISVKHWREKGNQY